MWPSSMSISPPVVSMWAFIEPSPKGTSVRIRFIFIGAGAAPPLPLNSSRIFLASSIHSGLRNGYFGKAVSFDSGRGVSARCTLVPGLHLDQIRQRPRLDLGGDLVGRGQRPHDEAPGEGRQLVEGPLDPP